MDAVLSALNIYLLRFKKPTMSLTAMARENALLERSTESNSAPSGTGIDLGDPAEYLSWHHDRSGTLGWERANGGYETPPALSILLPQSLHSIILLPRSFGQAISPV